VTAVGGTTLTPAAGGFTQTAWNGAGSGCSAYSAKPTWQQDTGCARRSVADVAAVADPSTGVAVYDSTANGGQSGWLVFGGTSVASPLVAGTYALAGKPTAGSVPASYAYAAPQGALTDVTSGSNGTCSGSYLCTAGTGYDGPTGLGTPNGTAAFTGSTVTPPPTPTPTPAPSSQLLGNPGFETGSATPWTSTSGVVDSSTAEPAHSGSWKAWLDGYGRTHTDTLSQTVTIPAAATKASLSFYLHIDTAETTTTAANDKLTVQVMSSSGTVLATLGSYSNLNKGTGYTLRTADMSAFLGKTVTLRFTGTENSSRQTSFVVDDTALTVQ
jgi:kumamolisin